MLTVSIIVEEYSPVKFWNIYETELFPQKIPGRIFTAKKKTKAPGFQDAEEYSKLVVCQCCWVHD